MTVTDLHVEAPPIRTVTAVMACVECNAPLTLTGDDELAPRFVHRAHLSCTGCERGYVLTCTLRPTESEDESDRPA